jgi:hypothetical protein
MSNLSTIEASRKQERYFSYSFFTRNITYSIANYFQVKVNRKNIFLNILFMGESPHFVILHRAPHMPGSALRTTSF